MKSSALIMLVGLVCTRTLARQFVPDGGVNPDDYTVLMAVDAALPAGCREFQPQGHGKFYIEGWTRADQVFRWEIKVPATDDYAVNVLVRCHGRVPLEVSVACGGHAVTGQVARGWTRQPLPGTLRLPAGQQTLMLEAHGADFAGSVMSVELVRPAAREHLQRAARRLRADTAWMRQARYGVMCHWTSQSFPRHGERQQYGAAVMAFDVERFADQIQATGAGFLVLTTSHAEMYIPAPIRALDRILPGRTSGRDLIAELAEALGKRGIRLMLYYHLGSMEDPAWLHACGFWESGTQKLFDNWCAVISEIGNRYREKLAGWWFDDGAVSYYYRSAPWEKLTTAAKAGNLGRVVGYNPWELPVPTLFQDFHCGEGFGDPGDERGQRDGLQACATLITETEWGHFRPDSEIGPPRWTAEQLAHSLRQFAASQVVPLFNVAIYQDGTISPRTIELFKQ